MECNYRPIECLSCNNRVLSGHLDEHIKTECPMRMVPCEYCGKQFHASELVVSLFCTDIIIYDTVSKLTFTKFNIDMSTV